MPSFDKAIILTPATLERLTNLNRIADWLNKSHRDCLYNPVIKLDLHTEVLPCHAQQSKAYCIKSCSVFIPMQTAVKSALPASDLGNVPLWVIILDGFGGWPNKSVIGSCCAYKLVSLF